MIFNNPRVRTEDAPEKSRQLLQPLISPLNYVIQQLNQIFNKNLTISDNFSGDVLTIYIDGIFPVDLKWKLPSKPVAVWIGKCYETSGNHTAFSNALYLDWEMTDSNVLRINNIVGLSATSSNPFNVTLVAITG